MHITKMTFAFIKSSEREGIREGLENEETQSSVLCALKNYVSDWSDNLGKGGHLDVERLYFLGVEMGCICPPHVREKLLAIFKESAEREAECAFLKGFHEQIRSIDESKKPE